jgi:hypothetical protein
MKGLKDGIDRKGKYDTPTMLQTTIHEKLVNEIKV